MDVFGVVRRLGCVHPREDSEFFFLTELQADGDCGPEEWPIGNARAWLEDGGEEDAFRLSLSTPDADLYQAMSYGFDCDWMGEKGAFGCDDLETFQSVASVSGHRLDGRIDLELDLVWFDDQDRVERTCQIEAWGETDKEPFCLFCDLWLVPPVFY